MSEEALAAHPEFHLQAASPAPPTPGGEDPNRPSIGIMSFSGEIFDGTALAYGEGKAYSKLKRCVPPLVPRAGSGSSSVDSHGCMCRSFTAMLCLVMIMSGLLVVIYVGYQANPKWQGDHTHYSNCAPLRRSQQPAVYTFPLTFRGSAVQRRSSTST